MGAPVLWALRAYRGTSMLLTGAVILTLAVAIPVTSLLRSDRPVHFRLTVPGAATASTGGEWQPPARSPAGTRQAAVDGLFVALVGATCGTALVACCTLLALFGARAADRSTEMSARRAVGASRRVLAGSTLAEGVLLATAGLLPGALAGVIAARFAASSWPGTAVSAAVLPSVLVGIGVSAVVVVCAMLPLIFARHRRVIDTPARPVPMFIPAVQLGLSLVVLTGGALLARHAVGTQASPAPGAGTGEVFRQSDEQVPPAARASSYAALLDQLSAGGSFDTVSLTASGGLVGLGVVSTVTTDCGQCTEGGIFLPWHIVPATHQFVSADSFRAMGIHLLAGRGITPHDRLGSEPVAVVSRGLALRHFQNGEALGRKILLGDDPRTWHTVVGVVDDPPSHGLGGPLQPPFTVYGSVLQHPSTSIELLVRPRGVTSVDAAAVAGISRALARPGRPTTVMSERELLAAESLPIAWFSRWFGVEGWAMLLLACGGAFTLMRLWVLSLLSELGLRRAMGARKAQVIRFVLLRAAAVGVAGVVGGLWFGTGVWGALGTSMTGVAAWHAPTIARFAALLVATAVAGALLPALDAARRCPARLLSWM